MRPNVRVSFSSNVIRVNVYCPMCSNIELGVCINVLSNAGKIYNIPIKLWLIETHPYNPPMVYVNPTATMQIKSGRHVDATGRIYLPYLHEWKHVSSNYNVKFFLMKIAFDMNYDMHTNNGFTSVIGTYHVSISLRRIHLLRCMFVHVLPFFCI